MEKRRLKELKRLYKILDAGEKGYGMSAVIVEDCGLKLLFTSFAEQRSRLKSDTLAEIQKLDTNTTIKSSLIGAIHRGSISILAALTFGRANRERVILKEILISEQFALLTYSKILKDGLHPVNGLDPGTLEFIARQLVDVRQVVDQVAMIQGKDRKQLVVSLFDSDKEAEAAILEMNSAGFFPRTIKRLDVDNVVSQFKRYNAVISETVVSGLIRGAFWGSLVGTMAGFGLLEMGVTPFSISESLWASLILLGVFFGGLFGSLLGSIIGITFWREESRRSELGHQGKTILLALVDVLWAPKVREIISRDNLNVRAEIESTNA